MKKWILLSLALIPLAGCAYYPDDYYGSNRYSYYNGSDYRHRDYDRNWHRYGYRDYDRDHYYRDYDRY